MDRVSGGGVDVLTLSIRQPWAWLIVRPDITDPRERAAAVLAQLRGRAG